MTWHKYDPSPFKVAIRLKTKPNKRLQIMEFREQKDAFHQAEMFLLQTDLDVYYWVGEQPDQLEVFTSRHTACIPADGCRYALVRNGITDEQNSLRSDVSSTDYGFDGSGHHDVSKCDICSGIMRRASGSNTTGGEDNDQ